MKVISVILWCGGGIEICLLILQLMVMSEIVWWTFPLIARVAITTGAFVTKSIECLLLLFLFTIFTCSDIYRKETKLHQTSLQESYISCRNHTLSSLQESYIKFHKTSQRVCSVCSSKSWPPKIYSEDSQYLMKR